MGPVDMDLGRSGKLLGFAGASFPIDRVDLLICSDLQLLLAPIDRVDLLIYTRFAAAPCPNQPSRHVNKKSIQIAEKNNSSSSSSSSSSCVCAAVNLSLSNAVFR
jgi:hypothetical protein